MIMKIMHLKPGDRFFIIFPSATREPLVVLETSSPATEFGPRTEYRYRGERTGGMFAFQPDALVWLERKK